MTTAVPITVHRTAICGVNVLTDQKRSILPSLLIWADLSPLANSGFPLGMNADTLPILHMINADPIPNTASLTLTVSSDEDGPQPLRTPKNPTAPSHLTTLFSLTLPSATLGVLTSLAGSDAHLRIGLLHGKPPRNTEHAVVNPAKIDVAIRVDTTVLHDALNATLPNIFTRPLTTDDVADEDADHNTAARHLLWPIAAGMSLGHPVALNHAIALALRFAHTPTPENIAIVADTFQFLTDTLTRSQHYIEHHCDAPDATADALPTPIATLLSNTNHTLHEHALLMLINQIPLPLPVSLSPDSDPTDTAPMVGALTAALILLASRAHIMSLHSEHPGYSAPYYLAMWMTDPDDTLTWMFPAALPLLSQHDTEVLTTSLITTNTNQDHPVEGLLRSYLHTLIEAILEATSTHNPLSPALLTSDVQPANFPDVTLLADTINTQTDEHAHTAPCVECAITNSTFNLLNWPVERFASAAVALLPALADLSAASEHFAVGEPSWVNHRTQYLDHWLNEADQ